MRSLMRARRSVRNKYKTPSGKYYQRRFRMRSNPGGMFVDTLKSAAPVAAALYGTRFISRWAAPRIPGFNMVPAVAQGPVMAGLMVFGAHFLTKKVGKLSKYRGQILLGAGLNLVDQIVSAVAPASVKGAFGLGEYHSVYDNALSDYIAVGASPLDDEITLSDYVEVGQLEEELGAMEELGLMEELGEAEASANAATIDASNAFLGGVSQSAMMKPIASQPMVAAIPTRSFTRKVPRAGTGYDSSKTLYTGIFAGGFGN